MKSLDLIAAERRRQIEEEGFTEAHDERYANGELAVAASHYAAQSPLAGRAHDRDQMGRRRLRQLQQVPQGWPFPRKWWKPQNRIRMLVKAAALIAAEIDRLLREEEAAKQTPQPQAPEGDAAEPETPAPTPDAVAAHAEATDDGR